MYAGSRTILSFLGLILMISGCYEPARYIRATSPYPFESATHGDRFRRTALEHRFQISGVPQRPFTLVDTLEHRSPNHFLDTTTLDTIVFPEKRNVSDNTRIYSPSVAISYSFGYHFTEHIAMGTTVSANFYANTNGYSPDRSLEKIEKTAGYWYSFGGPLGKSKRFSLEYRNAHILAGTSKTIRSFTSPNSNNYDSVFIVRDTMFSSIALVMIEHSIAAQYRLNSKIGIYSGTAMSHALTDWFSSENEIENYSSQNFSLYGGVSYYRPNGIASIQAALLNNDPSLSFSYTLINRHKDGKGTEK